MFKLIKKARLQIAVFVLAIGGAFATNAMSGNSLALVDGYQRIDNDGYVCVAIDMKCSTIPNDFPCTYEVSSTETIDLFHKETLCVVPLYQPNPQ